MTADQRAEHRRLSAVACEYLRIRDGLAAARDAAEIEATRIELLLAQVEDDIVDALEALRGLEGDEEFIAS